MADKDPNVDHVQTTKETVSGTPVTKSEGYNASHEKVAGGTADGHGPEAAAEATEHMHTDAAEGREAAAKDGGDGKGDSKGGDSKGGDSNGGDSNGGDSNGDK